MAACTSPKVAERKSVVPVSRFRAGGFGSLLTKRQPRPRGMSQLPRDMRDRVASAHATIANWKSPVDSKRRTCRTCYSRTCREKAAASHAEAYKSGVAGIRDVTSVALQFQMVVSNRVALLRRIADRLE